MSAAAMLADTRSRPGALGGAWQAWVALVALAGTVAFPLVATPDATTWLLGGGSGAILAALMLLLAILAGLFPPGGVGTLAVFAGAAIGVVLTVTTLDAVAAFSATKPSASELLAATRGFWCLMVASWMLGWLLLKRLADIATPRPVAMLLLRIATPLVFGVWVILFWEVTVRGFHVPLVILPPPSAIWVRLTTSVAFFDPSGAIVSGVLWDDFRQTFLKSVVAGYAMGCGSGFLIAIAVDRVPFLRRGLLPVGNLVSALPIIGVAPIMVMWFGFDWQSKAAVVVAMTFFPMLVNTLAGLAASEDNERALMHTYAANYWQSLVKLRLPAALPFIFNALKINSTLAMIGAIVAEFFGTPIVGMGFRISTEVGRMNTDMVWAEIAVAALAGSAFYGVVALIERVTTFWHPSFRT